MKRAVAIAAHLTLPLTSAIFGDPQTQTLNLRSMDRMKNRGKAGKLGKFSKSSKSSKMSKSDSSKSRSGGGGGGGEGSALYIMTNAEGANAVQMYRRDHENGRLEYWASFATGGEGGGAAGADEGSLSGAGDPLGSTDSLQVAGQCLLASNAGSDTVTTFNIDDSGVLIREGYYDSHGDLPVSIGYKEHGDDYYLVYVLNAGGEGTLAGFMLDSDTCEMEYISDSEVSLGQQDTRDPPFAVASPSQVGFVPGADWLVVNIKGKDGEPGRGTISFYPVHPDGTLGTPEITTSNGYVPFAFAFDDAGALLSMEAAGDEPPPPQDTSSAVSSYAIDVADGSLAVIEQESIENKAGCWVRHSDGCVVTTNGNGSISSLKVDDGDLTLLEANADDIENPIDLAFTDDSNFLYVLSGGNPGIYVYEAENCELDRIQVMTMGVPDIETTVNGVVGLALYP